tara:strand:- start:50 stop:1078 length:1029 start_codon:yes stop_codon:yes gene_type:complete
MISVVKHFSLISQYFKQKGRLIMSTFLFFTLSCSKVDSFQIQGFTMGTSYVIKINETRLFNEKLNVKSGIDSILLKINNIFSTYIDTSEISLFNKSINDTVLISYHFKKILNESLRVYEDTEGSFDPTIGPLLNLWNFGNDQFQFPNNKYVSTVLNNVGLKNISINENYIVKNNINFDFNAIAKGYAVDIIRSYLENLGQKNFMIEIGGELYCSEKKNNYEWSIGLQNPYVDSEYIKIIKLKNKAIATSGTYRNFYNHGGKSYSHIINPMTGFPVKHKTVSVTVVANNCLTADAYATGLLVLGNKKGLDVANRIEDIEAMFITGDKNDYVLEYSNDFKSFID